LGDNVQKLNVRRKAVDVDAPVASSLARAVFEPIGESPVHQQVANLAQEFVSRVEAPLPEEVRVQAVEPINLGGADAPMTKDIAAPLAAMREVAREPMPQEREKRGMFSGLFGGRRRAERLARAQTEAGMMPGATNCVVHKESVSERRTVVRADRAHREQLGAAAHQDRRFTLRVAEHRHAFGERGKRNARAEIGAGQFGRFIAHGCPQCGFGSSTLSVPFMFG